MQVFRGTLSVLVAGCVCLACGAGGGEKGGKSVDTRVYEMRTYYANPGKMSALHDRFRNHTCKLLEKHGMMPVGFWTDSAEPDRKLIWIVAHPNRAAADSNWKAFGADPDWQKAKAASEVGGTLVEKVDRVWMNPTDYSKLK